MALIGWAFAAAIFAIGATLAFTSQHALKRLMGVCLAQAAASLAALTLHAPALAIVGAAGVLASATLGAALAMRLQEAFGGDGEKASS